mmetsp:Transcript_1416/g.4407  ORF Transcript_1416/g.4407 Transcript_1416/m.4407 type:complete len:220 (-) Transcript_1416:78-737(-)
MRHHVQGYPRPGRELHGLRAPLLRLDDLPDGAVREVLAAEVRGEHVRQGQLHQDLVLLHALADLEPPLVPAPLAQVVRHGELGVDPPSGAALDPLLQALELRDRGRVRGRVLEELPLQAGGVAVPPAHGVPVLEARRDEPRLLPGPEQDVGGAVGEQDPEDVVAEDAKVLLQLGRLLVLEHHVLLLLLPVVVRRGRDVPVVVHGHGPPANSLLRRRRTA